MEPIRSRALTERMANELAPVDKRIIELLQQDGRRPFTQIAGEIGVSEAAVRARTNRLIERGILQIVGVTDPLRLGFHQMAMIGIRCDGARLVRAAEEIAALPEVSYAVITAGHYDILVETVCEDNEALLSFLADRLRHIEGVREAEVFVYLRIVKETYQWGHAEPLTQSPGHIPAGSRDTEAAMGEGEDPGGRAGRCRRGQI